MTSPPVKPGYYHLYSDNEPEPVLVHCYYSTDTQQDVIGFNAHDGGGILPVSDLVTDGNLVPVTVTETV